MSKNKPKKRLEALKAWMQQNNLPVIKPQTTQVYAKGI